MTVSKADHQNCAELPVRPSSARQTINLHLIWEQRLNSEPPAPAQPLRLRAALGGLFMLCLSRPALGLALVGVCLLGTRTFATELMSAVLAFLQ
jgi:hypothetical protein